MRMLTFLLLVLAGQANIYVLRERGHFWQSHPARVMLLASWADLAIVTYLAAEGLLMTSLQLVIIGGLFVTTIGYAMGLDLVKMAVLSRLRID
jgi:H+-transporting ATPase